jgi:hypothetical protein
MLEIGALFLRTETELILKSRRVVPGRLFRAGFKFQFPDRHAAVKQLVEQWHLNAAGTKVSGGLTQKSFSGAS